MMDDSLHKGITTFIGAVEYMAPEAINGNFDQKADLWALGIVTFELKFKENPLEKDGHVNPTIAEYEALIERNFLQEKINSKIGYMSHEFR
jgi:serine/threonine protein kinase